MSTSPDKPQQIHNGYELWHIMGGPTVRTWNDMVRATGIKRWARSNGQHGATWAPVASFERVAGRARSVTRLAGVSARPSRRRRGWPSGSSVRSRASTWPVLGDLVGTDGKGRITTTTTDGADALLKVVETMLEMEGL